MGSSDLLLSFFERIPDVTQLTSQTFEHQIRRHVRIVHVKNRSAPARLLPLTDQHIVARQCSWPQNRPSVTRLPAASKFAQRKSILQIRVTVFSQETRLKMAHSEAIARRVAPMDPCQCQVCSHRAMSWLVCQVQIECVATSFAVRYYGCPHATCSLA